ncbi:MAG: response regulator, partial [Bacteroidales bacterium]|nr:response regulator [Bacteroidales bacterium]
QKQKFTAPQNKKGTIEIFYLKEFPKEDEGPFLKEERNLLINLANLIAGSAAKEIFNKLQVENRERLKELWGINQTSQIIAEGKSIDETLQEICNVINKSWQYPKYTVARIVFEDKVYISPRFKETKWGQKEYFVTIDNNKGSIEIFYLKEFPHEDEGPFLKEERNLLINLAKLISGYINNLKGREIYTTKLMRNVPNRSDEYRKSLIKNKQPLQLFFNKQIIDKYIYFDMMKYKVKEILFVATLYDAFMLENEDHFFEQFMGEIYQYSLFSLPRITGVTSAAEAVEMIETTHFDLVILMAGIDQEAPIELSKVIKTKKPDLPVYLLLKSKKQYQVF